MSDPTDIEQALETVTDAFDHRMGGPTFEPGIDSSSEASDGTVVLQKACRLLASADYTYRNTEYYTSVLEHSFAAIERSLEGYLISIAGDDPEELRDHSTPYRRAKGHAPLESETVEQIERFYRRKRVSYYYGTSVATGQQAKAMFDLATTVHSHLVGFDSDIRSNCLCEN